MADGTAPSKLLLVEGVTDYHVVGHLIERAAPMLVFSIVQKGNVENVLKAISVEINVSGRTALGILVDANDSWENRWQAVSNRLQRAGIDLRSHAPGGPQALGVTIEGIPRKPRIGIWLMPDNKSPGELENFIENMIPSSDQVWPLAQAYIDGIPGPREFPGGKELRAQIHAWLATRKEPRQPGLAIKTRDRRTDGPLAQTFVGWLRRLFE